MSRRLYLRANRSHDLMPIREGLYASPESTRELEHPLEATSGDHVPATRPVLPIKPPPRIRYSTVPSFSSDAFAVRLQAERQRAGSPAPRARAALAT